MSKSRKFENFWEGLFHKESTQYIVVTSNIIVNGGQNFPTICKSVTISNKLKILESFLSRYDQYILYMNAEIGNLVSLEPVLLVKLKNVSAH